MESTIFFLWFFASFITVFSFIFLSFYFLWIGRVARRRQSWDILTVLDGWTVIMCRRLTLEFASVIALTRSLSISSHYFMALGEGGKFWCFSRSMSIGRRFCCLVTCLNSDVYFFRPEGWCRSNFGAEGFFRRVFSPRALDRDIFAQIGLWSYLRPWFTGRWPP